MMTLSHFVANLELEEDLLSKISQLESSLSKERENGALLQHQVEDLLTRHSEEVATRDDNIRQLNNELEAKANVIALMTQQLYQTRIKLKQEIEARAAVKTNVCVCPHCFVHQKLSSSSGPDSRLSPLREVGSPSPAEADTGSSTNSSLSDTTSPGKWVVPTPPISPRPPPNSVSRNHSIKKRASTPIRRQSPSPRNNTSAESGTEETHVNTRWALRPARTSKDPGQLSTDLQQLLSMKEQDKVVARRDTHPVLPPISQDDQTTSSVSSRARQDSSTSSRTFPGMSAHPRHGHHQRLVLAKSKGLSSAPSTLRVLHYGSRTPRQELEEVGSRGVRGVAQEEGGGEEGEGVEGSGGAILMVKETDSKGSVGPAQWDTDLHIATGSGH